MNNKKFYLGKNIKLMKNHYNMSIKDTRYTKRIIRHFKISVFPNNDFKSIVITTE